MFRNAVAANYSESGWRVLVIVIVDGSAANTLTIVNWKLVRAPSSTTAKHSLR